ncbi:hypothetical protein AB0451_37995 [Streptomyces sp. NPDC052000]|uniref:hypothetical protein n=1 Tax=Streptomyces sp. NPDC052000 TaxID=3155676 RepID=UPI00344D77B6
MTTATNPNPTPEPTTPAPAVPAPTPAPHVDPTLRRIVTALAIGVVLLLVAFLCYVVAEHPTAAQPIQAGLNLLGVLVAGGAILATLHAINRRP